MGKFRERLISRFSRRWEKVFPDNVNIVKHTEDPPEFGFITIFKGYTESEGRKFKLKVNLNAFPSVLKSVMGIRKALKEIKKNPENPRTSISKEELKEMEEFILSEGVGKVGYTELKPHEIFDKNAVLSTHVIVLIKEMDKEKIDKAPSGITNTMIMQTYAQMGKQANILANYLRKKGFTTQAGPALGGSSIYPIQAKRSGIGWIGRHGMLITPEYGPRQRIAVVYTSIENLPITNKNEHEWIGEFCSTCGACIRACPTNAILEKPIDYPSGRKTHIEIFKCATGFMNHGCTICIKECVFSKLGYTKCFETHQKKTQNRYPNNILA